MSNPILRLKVPIANQKQKFGILTNWRKSYRKRMKSPNGAFSASVPEQNAFFFFWVTVFQEDNV